MIGHLVACGLAGYPSLVNNLLEIAPLRIAQERLQFSGEPEFLTINLVGVVLEVLMQLDDDVTFHGMTSFVDD
jgi:hypothetical protein